MDLETKINKLKIFGKLAVLAGSVMYTSGCVVNTAEGGYHPIRDFMNGAAWVTASPEKQQRLKEEERQQKLQEQQQGYRSAYP